MHLGISLQLGKHKQVEFKEQANLEEGISALEKFCSTGMVLLPAYLKWKREEGWTGTKVTTVIGNWELHRLFLLIR